jgi:hypothetical protein
MKIAPAATISNVARIIGDMLHWIIEIGAFAQQT